MSHWPEFSARPLCSGSKAESLTTSLRFMPLAISEMMSMAQPLKPVGEDLSKSSNGGKGTSEQSVRVPDVISFAPLEVVPPPPPPQAESDRPSREAAKTTA